MGSYCNFWKKLVVAAEKQAVWTTPQQKPFLPLTSFGKSLLGLATPTGIIPTGCEKIWLPCFKCDKRFSHLFFALFKHCWVRSLIDMWYISHMYVKHSICCIRLVNGSMKNSKYLFSAPPHPIHAPSCCFFLALSMQRYHFVHTVFWKNKIPAYSFILWKARLVMPTSLWEADTNTLCA